MKGSSATCFRVLGKVVIWLNVAASGGKQSGLVYGPSVSGTKVPPLGLLQRTWVNSELRSVAAASSRGDCLQVGCATELRSQVYVSWQWVQLCLGIRLVLPPGTFLGKVHGLN